MIIKILLSLICSILFYNWAAAQQDTGTKHYSIRSSAIFEAGLSTQINTFGQLDEKLRSHNLDRRASSTYLTAGIGYSSHFKDLSLSTIGRYGVNLFRFNQYFLDWNIIRLSWAFNVKDKLHLSPMLGFGIIHMPVSVKVDGNTQSSISGLAANPNYLAIRNSWGYLNFGIAISTHRIDRTNYTIGLVYATGLNKELWKNGDIDISDIPRASMHSISLSLSFSRY